MPHAARLPGAPAGTAGAGRGIAVLAHTSTDAASQSGGVKAGSGSGSPGGALRSWCIVDAAVGGAQATTTAAGTAYLAHMRLAARSIDARFGSDAMRPVEMTAVIDGAGIAGAASGDKCCAPPPSAVQNPWLHVYMHAQIKSMSEHVLLHSCLLMTSNMLHHGLGSCGSLASLSTQCAQACYQLCTRLLKCSSALCLSNPQRFAIVPAWSCVYNSIANSSQVHNTRPLQPLALEALRSTSKIIKQAPSSACLVANW
jgi:hypothetical protein